MIDYHTHTTLCKHAEGSPLEYLHAAERAGLDELGVADHAPWPSGYDSQVRMDVSQYAQYKKIIDDLRARKSKVKVRYAIEADYVPGRMDEIIPYVEAEDYDYVLGSIHYVDNAGLGFDQNIPEVMKEWNKPSGANFIWRDYIDCLNEFVKYDFFDIIAHVDVPKKFKFYPDSEVMDYFLQNITAAFKTAGEKGKSLEINTCGWRVDIGEQYPALDLLKLACASGLTLTFGSDAHAPELVAYRFADAVLLAKAAGFTHYASYEKRRKTLHLLP